MNSPTENANTRHAGRGAVEAEATLRLIAGLPAPEGLEDRVKAALRAAPRTAQVLPWPSAPAPGQGWLGSALVRGAAAAAIVFVVAGGGWSVYSHVQPARTPNALAMPHMAAPGGFSSAGAMRTPQTLSGPVLKHPVTVAPKQHPATKTPAHAMKKTTEAAKANGPGKAAKELVK